MRKIQSSSKLLILFVLAILVPSLLLGYFAVTTVEQEEAVIEHHWKESLANEVYHVADLTRQQLTQVQKELDRIIVDDGLSIKEQAEKWESKSAYVEIPFILSKQRFFLWPSYSEGLTLSEWSFVKNNFDFFKDRQGTPSFDNKAIWDKSAQNSKNIIMKIESGEQRKPGAITFSQITKNRQSGIIPQMIDNKLYLVYWQKLDKGRIGGCLINEEHMMNKLLEILPRMYSNQRALNILNEVGQPFYGFNRSMTINWKKPFLAVRISDTLPFWQVAAYLTNPALIEQSAKSTAYIIWIMISILVMTIIMGGYIIIKTLKNQIEIAHQKTTFAANVSHELRTPLTSLKMFIEMLQEEGLSQNKKEEYLNIMDDETQRLNRLINNILDFSRSNEKKKVYLKGKADITQIIKDVVDKQRFPLEKKGFSIQYEMANGPLMVECDKEAIQQVILNLMDNAVKYSDQEKEIKIHGETKDSKVIIKVEDKGIGIDPRNIEKIFMAYYRADDQLASRSQGTGLGLTIAQQIIKDHQGEIFYRRKDQGSIFQIELPLSKE